MIEFTSGQKKVIASAITMLSLGVVIAFVAFFAYMALRLLQLTSAAVVPVIAGFFLALFFRPYYTWWKKTVPNANLALVIMLTTVFVPIGFFLWYAGSVLVDQISNLIAQGPTLFHQVVVWFRGTFPKLHSLLLQFGVPYDRLGDVYLRYGSTALEAGSGALRCLSGVVSILVSLCFFVFFLTTRERRGGELVDKIPFLKADTRVFLAEQINVFVDILVNFFQRQTVICLIEGVMYGTGFWLVGLPYGFMIGFVLGVLNLIPFFGSIVCLPIALPLAYFANGGSTTKLLLVLAVWLTGQILDGYLITPKIQGDKTGLSYAGVIFSFFFWDTLLGPMLGMLLAIPLSAFCVVLWRALKAHYLRPVA